jgi:hypothetical protein
MMTSVLYSTNTLGWIFSSPGHRPCELLSWVSVRRPLAFHIYIFFSETAEQKSAKLARNVHWMVLYQICVFGADLKSNMAARAHNVF